MTGQELIDYIQEGKLQDRHVFIDVEGYLSPIQQVMENERGESVFDYAEESDWTQEDVDYIKFGRR